MGRSPVTIQLENISKRFSRKPVFKPVSFQIQPGEVIAITGQNGSGKSTLLKIIANILAQSTGSVTWNAQNKRLSDDEIRLALGYVAPYMELYDELTAAEHVQLVHRLKGSAMTSDEAASLLESLGLDEVVIKTERRLRAFSSGMKQRVRIAMALATEPSVLLLDEPTSNLDEAGIEKVFERIQSVSLNNTSVVIATNDQRERALAGREIALERS